MATSSRTRVEADIERLIDSDMLEPAVARASTSIGRAHRDEAAQTRYIEYAKRTLPKSIDLTGLRVVVDCANGAAYKVAPTALWELGAEVFTIGVEPDGFNINDKVGSTAPEALTAKVQASCGPISASRSMAMRTASSSSMKRARSSMATSSWR